MFAKEPLHRAIEPMLTLVEPIAPAKRPSSLAQRIQQEDLEPVPNELPQFEYTDFDYCILSLTIAIKARDLERLGKEIEYLKQFTIDDARHCRRWLNRALTRTDKRWLSEQRSAFEQFL